MRSSFNKILWGIIFIALHINIGRFDLLPDFLGFCFIYSGCKVLKKENKEFKNVRTICMPVIGVSLLMYLGVFSKYSFVIQSIIGFILNIALTLIIYLICKGTFELAKKRELHEFAKSIEFRCNLYIVTILLVNIITPFLYNTGSDTVKVISTIIIIIGIISNILIMLMINRAKKEIMV